MVLQEDMEDNGEKKESGKGGRQADYDALPLGEWDWEFGENVVVYAVGVAGENVLVSVGEAVESNTVRMEATMRIRSEMKGMMMVMQRSAFSWSVRKEGIWVCGECSN